MSKHTFLAFALVGLLVLSGCGQGGPGVPAKSPWEPLSAMPLELVGTWSTAIGAFSFAETLLKMDEKATLERVAPAIDGKPAILGKLTHVRRDGGRVRYRLEVAPGVTDKDVIAVAVEVQDRSADEKTLIFDTHFHNVEAKVPNFWGPGTGIELPLGSKHRHIVSPMEVPLKKLTATGLARAMGEYDALVREREKQKRWNEERDSRVAKVREERRSALVGAWVVERVELYNANGHLLLEEKPSKAKSVVLPSDAGWWISIKKDASALYGLTLETSLGSRGGLFDWEVAKEVSFNHGGMTLFGMAPDSFSAVGQVHDGEFRVYRYKRVTGAPAGLPNAAKISLDKSFYSEDPKKQRETFLEKTKGKWFLQRVDQIEDNGDVSRGSAYDPAITGDLKYLTMAPPTSLEIGAGGMVSIRGKAVDKVDFGGDPGSKLLFANLESYGLYLVGRATDELRLAFTYRSGGHLVMTYGPKEAPARDLTRRHLLFLVELNKQRQEIRPFDAEKVAVARPKALARLEAAVLSWKTKPDKKVPIPASLRPLLKLAPMDAEIGLARFDALRPELGYLLWDELVELAFAIEMALL